MQSRLLVLLQSFDDTRGCSAAVLKTDDADVNYEFGNENSMQEAENNAYEGGNLLPVNKFHDYFTSCLPYPQRGPDVTLPMSGNAPVSLYGPAKAGKATKYGTGNTYEDGTIFSDLSEGAILGTSSGNGSTKFTFEDGSESPGAYAYADLNQVTAATINDLRKAVAVQQYYEALARGGSRYREQVQSLWNVFISDKTVQVPEYLGGGRYHVNINQVVQTAENDKSPLGETGAMSVTPINESSFTKSFEEHGFVIGVCCVRHNRSYQQGLERFWSREDRLDYYVPQFANIGEQPVKKKEIMLTGEASDEETFGYQEAWADYRMKPNRVPGLMRSNATGTLDFWHYGDYYESVPTLSQEWMEEGKKEIARTLVVENEPQFFGAIRVANKTTRRMPLYSVPGLYKL